MFKQIIFFVCCLFSLNSLFANESIDGEKSPFTDVLFDSAPSVVVTVNGINYHLLSINGLKRADIMLQCETKFTSNCQCMFAEKFSSMMQDLGYELNNKVNLGLYLFQTHEVSNVEIELTEENSEEVKINRSLRNEVCF